MVMGAPSGKTPRTSPQNPYNPVRQKEKMHRLEPKPIRGTRMAQLPVSSSFLITLMIAEALFAIPAGIVLKRIGRSMWWALLCFVPLAALLGLWVLAFSRWTPRPEA